MARQKGIVKLRGTIGDITFYKTQDGHLVREKGGLDARRIANDPAFQRTRENNSEFGRAGKAGKVLRDAFRGLLMNSADNRVIARLTQTMMKVIKADLVSARGLRNVLDGETELLNGFEFNVRGKLGGSFHVPFVGTLTRLSGEIKAEVGSFVPTELVQAPSGTTHFKLVCGGAEVDFEAGTYVASTSESEILPWDINEVASSSLTNTVTPNSTKPLFLVLGVAFYQEVNGDMYSLRNGAYNPLAIVGVDGGA